MATRLENLNTRLDTIAQILASGTWGPDVSEQGRSVGLVAYRKSLLDEQDQLLKTVSGMAPFTILTRTGY